MTKFQIGEIEQDIQLDVARKSFAIVPLAETRRSSRKGGAALLGGVGRKGKKCLR